MSPSALPPFVGFAPSEISRCVNREVVEEHVELAESLWPQHVEALAAPNYDLADLAYLDERIEANVMGIVIARDAGLEACAEILDMSEAAGAFVLFSVAHHLDALPQLEQAVQAVAEEPALLPGIASALGWIPWSSIEHRLEALWRSGGVLHRALALEGFAAHRRSPGAMLDDALHGDHPLLAAQAARAIGVLGLDDRLPLVAPLLSAQDEACRYAAAWSTVRLEGSYTAEALRVIDAIAADAGSPFADAALVLAIRARGRGALSRYETLRDRLEPRRRHLAAAAVGDPALVDGLIADAADDAIAATAGNAFSLITGIDLEYHDLDREAPAEDEASEESAPGGEDQDALGDEDDDDQDEGPALPLPDPERLYPFWQRERGRFEIGQRYLGGQPITEDGMREVLARGKQQARQAAAFELGRLVPGPLEDTDGPGFRQARRYLGWA